ncbi:MULTISPECIES: hypothetical protein [Companilactobacillus]|uniref:DUF3892 domain-containing protein n=1 Tax=Companilactobacillus nantensis DSM 16982 TaxID=1423774 RepID=A0A0R1WIA0_9LACO|nr:hypothetical protein [Companilactobacillus nantensis]KRM17471.1 hypothetical protein FD31_GL002662 [Companilactobacillus nantensis DSM 16982]GEO64444.1 hypothetical protein LNA01_16270 [Companilactobacillus nantensis]
MARIKVTSESDSGRNNSFHDNYKGTDMSRQQFVNEINKGNYPNYSVKKIHNIPTPVSKPDSSINNNLG